MTPQEFANKMHELRRDLGDPEATHSQADKLMCEALRRLGYEAGVEIFEKMELWYA